MRNVFAICAALCMVGQAVWYCGGIIRKRFHPTFAQWLIFEIGVAMTFITRVASGKFNLASNVANSMDVLYVTGILVVLLATGGAKHLQFNKFHKWCIGTAIILAAVWVMGNTNARIANYAFNLLMVVAYWPLFETLLDSDENPESFFVWGFSFVTGSFALAAAVIGHDALAELYVIRALCMIAITLVLMGFVELREALVGRVVERLREIEFKL